MDRTEQVLAGLKRRHRIELQHAERVLYALQQRDADRAAFADTLRDVAAQGCHQVRIAEWLGMSRQSVNNIIKGR